MVEKEEIREKARRLVSKQITNLNPSDEEIWEGEECGAKFMLTKDIMPPNPAMKAIYSLSVSGNLDGQVKVVGDFIDTFGRPTWREESSEIGNGEIVVWNADKVDQKRG
jgi:hypothetical protein